MAEDAIEVEALLAPVPGGDGGGAGTNLEGDYSDGSPWPALRDALRDARDAERGLDAAGEADPPMPPAWREVKRLSLACLAERTKDFRIAAWLTEALVRTDGLAGLRAGARVIEGLAEHYWEQGFPLPDEEGLEDRASALGALAGQGGDGTLMKPLRRLALFRRADGNPVGLHLWKAAEDTAGLADANRKKARLAAGIPDLEALNNEARLDLARAALRATAIEARSTGRAWAAADARLGERFGAQGAPSMRAVAEALALMLEIAERILGPIPEDLLPEAAAPEAADAPVPGAEAEAGHAPAQGRAGPPPLRTREDAIRQLEELADWFRRTEPHSPLAYTLAEAVRRARLPLPDLLAEVLPDDGARKAMLTMLGIRAIEPPAA